MFAPHTYRSMGEDGIWVVRNGRHLLSFSSNGYLNFTQQPAIKQAAIAAIRQCGARASVARLVTGNHPLFAELEVQLTRLKGVDAVYIFDFWYFANTGIVLMLVECASKSGLDLIEREIAAAWPLAKAKVFSCHVGLSEAPNPIVPVVIGSATAARAAACSLEEEGFLVAAIRPLTVPSGTACLRITFTAAHPDTERERLAETVLARIVEH